jgi:hypothetical protein
VGLIPWEVLRPSLPAGQRRRWRRAGAGEDRAASRTLLSWRQRRAGGATSAGCARGWAMPGPRSKKWTRGGDGGGLLLAVPILPAHLRYSQTKVSLMKVFSPCSAHSAHQAGKEGRGSPR